MASIVAATRALQAVNLQFNNDLEMREMGFKDRKRGRRVDAVERREETPERRETKERGGHGKSQFFLIHQHSFIELKQGTCLYINHNPTTTHTIH